MAPSVFIFYRDINGPTDILIDITDLSVYIDVPFRYFYVVYSSDVNDEMGKYYVRSLSDEILKDIGRVLKVTEI